MKKHKRKELGLSALMLLGAAFALAVTLTITLALAIISSMTDDPTALTGAFALLSLLLSGGVSALITSRVNGEGGTLVAILSSVIAASVILVIGLVWKRGALNLGAPLNLFAFIGVSVMFAILGKKRTKRRRR